jgi:hypothetical protein
MLFADLHALQPTKGELKEIYTFKSAFSAASPASVELIKVFVEPGVVMYQAL